MKLIISLALLLTPHNTQDFNFGNFDMMPSFDFQRSSIPNNLTIKPYIPSPSCGCKLVGTFWTFNPRRFCYVFRCTFTFLGFSQSYYLRYCRYYTIPFLASASASMEKSTGQDDF